MERGMTRTPTGFESDALGIVGSGRIRPSINASDLSLAPREAVRPFRFRAVRSRLGTRRGQSCIGETARSQAVGGHERPLHRGRTIWVERRMMRPSWMRCLMDAFLEMHATPCEEIVIDLDATDDPVRGK